MEEKNVDTKPQVDTENSPAKESENQTQTPQDEVVIPVKFNKETRNLTADEAATLAQKGMKYEIIENDYQKLKSLAAKSKKSVPMYISELQKRETAARREELLKECGGNETLADRVMELENAEIPDDGLDELREYFPTVKSLDDLPRAVVESARLKGENLLNAYLKFRFIKKRQKTEEDLFERAVTAASVGSLKSPKINGEDTFIKALWGR